MGEIGLILFHTMSFIVGIIIFSFLCLSVLALAYFFFLLINELIVISFDFNPIEWMKWNICEPIGRWLLELIHPR